jgi:hypothetical protein
MCGVARDRVAYAQPTLHIDLTSQQARAPRNDQDLELGLVHTLTRNCFIFAFASLSKHQPNLLLIRGRFQRS